MADVSGDLRVTERLKIPASELQWRFSGSGGPGGQHANTSNTKVALTWNAERSEALTDYQRKLVLDALGPVVRVVAVDERSQTRTATLLWNASENVCGRLLLCRPGGDRLHQRCPLSGGDLPTSVFSPSARRPGEQSRTPKSEQPASSRRATT